MNVLQKKRRVSYLSDTLEQWHIYLYEIRLTWNIFTIVREEKKYVLKLLLLSLLSVLNFCIIVYKFWHKFWYCCASYMLHHEFQRLCFSYTLCSSFKSRSFKLMNVKFNVSLHILCALLCARVIIIIIVIRHKFWNY